MSPVSKILAVLGIPLKRTPGTQLKDTTKVVVMFHLESSPIFIIGRIVKISYEDWIRENLHGQILEIEVESSEGNGVLSRENDDIPWIWNNKVTPDRDESIKTDSLVFLCVDPR